MKSCKCLHNQIYYHVRSTCSYYHCYFSSSGHKIRLINDLFKVHNCCLCSSVPSGRPGLHFPIGWQSKICFGYLISSIHLTWFSNFFFYCANFFSTGSSLISKTSSFLLWSSKLYCTMHLVNIISAVFICYE